MGLTSKRQLIVPESAYGVCVWEVDGQYLSDEDGNFLSLEGRIHDRAIENKMREAAYYWLGESLGKPAWLNNARKISRDEWEDQKARLIAGQIPDEVEAVQQALRKGK